MTKQII